MSYKTFDAIICTSSILPKHLLYLSSDGVCSKIGFLSQISVVDTIPKYQSFTIS